MNRGAQLLGEKLAKHGTKRPFARWIGIEPAQLSHWLNGSRKPDTKQRAAIEDEHKIGWRTWDEETGDPAVTEPEADDECEPGAPAATGTEGA